MWKQSKIFIGNFSKYKKDFRHKQQKKHFHGHCGFLISKYLAKISVGT